MTNFYSIIRRVGGIVPVLISSLVVAQPTISSFTPANGPIGTVVTIQGTNFTTTAANNIVFFGATQATVQAASTTQLTVKVPAGASFAPISVLVNGLTGYAALPFLVTFPNGGTLYTKSFAPRVDLLDALNPTTIASGDLDGDGLPDIVIGNDNSTISLYRNTSKAGTIDATSFSTPVTFASGYPGVIAIGDVDGDGKPEMIISQFEAGTIAVYKNIATKGVLNAGSFASVVTLNSVAGSYPINFSIDDLDGDGKPEIVLIRNSAISIYVNKATPGVIDDNTFAAPTDISIAYPIGISIADLDADGKRDVVVSASNSTLSIFKNTSSPGAISLSSPVEITVYPLAIDIVIADLDNDSKPDIATSNGASYFNGAVQVFKNISVPGTLNSGSFAAKVGLQLDGPGAQIKAGDLNGDGKIDLITFNENFTNISIYNNVGTTGTIDENSFASRVYLGLNQNHNPERIAVGDLDADGKIDIAAVREFSGVSILRNQSGEVPAGPPSITSFSPSIGEEGTTLTITGMNFDPVPVNNIVYVGNSLATVTSSTSNTITATLNFGATSDFVTVTVNGVTGYSSNTFVSSFSGAGSFDTTTFAPPVSFPTADGPTQVVIGDLNLDGKSDLVTSNNDDGSLTLFENNSSSSAISLAPANLQVRVDVPADPDADGGPTDPYSYNYPNTLLLSDVDGDGKLDIAYGSGDANESGTVLNQTTSSAFSFVNNGDMANTDEGPVKIVTSDFDADGKPDIAIAGSDESDEFKLVILINTTSGLRDSSTYILPAYELRLEAPLAGPPSDVAVGDFNGDGKPDLAIATQGNSTFYVFPNTSVNGTVSFDTPTPFDTGGELVNIAVGDLDGDRKPDVAITNSGTNAVSIFRNISGKSSVAFDPAVDFAVGNNPMSLALGDLDGDGKLDVAVANANDATISVLRNKSAAGSITATSFYSKVDFSTPKLPYGVVIGDLNDDGLPEMISVNNSGSVSVFRNKSAGGISNEALTVYHGISPNADGLNEKWTLKNISLSNDTKFNHVTIFNRWGDNVFEVDNYDNDTRVFKGLNKNGTELASGTYFYRIEFSGGKSTLTGYLSVKK